MSIVDWIALGVVAWVVLAFCLGVVVGRLAALNDRLRPRR